MNQTTNGKKKGGCLGCLGIGCLVSIILVIVVVVGGSWYGLKKLKNVEIVKFLTGEKENTSVIEFAKTLKNDIEMTESDRSAGKFTFRNKKTGDWVTITKTEIIVNGQVYSIDSINNFKNFNTNKILEDIGLQTKHSNIEKKEDIPDWVPIFPTAEIESTIDFSGNNAKKGTIEMTTENSTDSIFTYYSKKLIEKGFTVEPKKKSFNDTKWLEILSINKKTNQKMTITIKEIPKGRKISIVYQWGE